MTCTGTDAYYKHIFVNHCEPEPAKKQRRRPLYFEDGELAQLGKKRARKKRMPMLCDQEEDDIPGDDMPVLCDQEDAALVQEEQEENEQN